MSATPRVIRETRRSIGTASRPLPPSRADGKVRAVIVFLHGVPETAAFYDALRAEIPQPSIALELPGFGCERPTGFGATKDDYVAWIAAQLERLDEPVDLVGHDWGAGFTYRLATTRPDLLRSWAADVASIVHPDQEWHDFAQVWQTPGDGEAFIAAMSP